MKLIIATDTVTYEDAQAALRSAYGRDARPSSALPVRAPYAGKFVLEPPPRARSDGAASVTPRAPPGFRCEPAGPESDR
jgi:hypothetical protein